ncbi:MAG: LAGLIDADG family homing endonuclease, partial [Planctomycetota bacterium]
MFLSEANDDVAALHLDRTCDDAEVQQKLTAYIDAHWAPREKRGRKRQLVAEHGTTTAVAETDTVTHTGFADNRMLSRFGGFVKCDEDRRLHFSEEAFTAGLAAQKHLLRGLFTADATVNESVELHGHGAALLGDIQTLLLGFGIKSTLLGGTATERRQVKANRAPATGLRIDTGSLGRFVEHIGCLPGMKCAELTAAADHAHDADENWDSVDALESLGFQQVFDLTEPNTSSFVAAGITVHNCSEYMFLDDTACNLASLNVLTFYDAETGAFDIDAFKHGTRIWTIVLEISVLMASFPSEAIARQSYQYRTLGLGYANLGAMLMQAGIPYDSEEGRAVCGALTAILTGESYAASAEMAGELGPFEQYAQNKEHMLRVMRNHRRAAYDASNDLAFRDLGDFEGLDVPPVGIDALQFGDQHPLLSRKLLAAARDCWDRALVGGEAHGYRNAQATVIAPTGTIGLLMDCDTTGVEPDFALVKFKKLAGGGYFKIANQSLRPALRTLGYGDQQIRDILSYVMGSLSLDDAPHVNREALTEFGFSPADLDAIEDSLPAMFELGFAFSPWSLKPETLDKLGVTDAHKNDPSFSLLRHLGFTRKQIDQANDHICGRGTVEGAPHLKTEHYPVFDCANKCG